MIADIFYVIVFLFIGLQFPKVLSLRNKDINRLKWLWFYHLIFGIAYYLYVSSQGGSDSLKYWNGAKKISLSEALMSLFEYQGTQAMYAINFIPSGVFDMSFFSGTILYCFIGFVGISLFYKIAVDAVPLNYKISNVLLFPTIFYLPNLHFWSSAIGKDTILFFCVALFTYALVNLKNRLPLLIFSSFLAYLVRPHIILFLFIGFALAFSMNKNIASYKRYVLFLLMLSVGAYMLPSVMEYAQVEELSIDSYEEFSDTKVSNLSRSHTGSSVDVSNYPFPLKVLTFLYRPTFIDINGIPALLAAIENFILFLLTIAVIKRRPVETFKKAPFIIKGLFFFLLIGTIAFSMSLGNLGIMLRMRNMFLPGMLIYICWSYSYYLQLKINKINLQKKAVQATS
ncbi:hypothetical protein [Pontibacter sp. H249]|uniref:hypothetical protein n=1 Tax=Pontibacter sp. H249 TaxID=3133420 RepID=UPI0030BCB682